MKLTIQAKMLAILLTVEGVAMRVAAVHDRLA